MRIVIRALVLLLVCHTVYAKTLTQATWVGGSDQPNQEGVYGTKGVASSSNMPGARMDSISWTDSNGNFWLFGGTVRYSGYYPSGPIIESFNDLWKFDGENWTWVSGSDLVNQAGVYGTQGVADPANMPGARSYSVSWIDSEDNLWLFGGHGYASIGNSFALNDLWKFDGTNWTWVSGSEYPNQAGVYGTKGVADPANVPGGRIGSMSWIDSDDNLWLFGGATFNVEVFNDLWKFDGTNWTWISGSDDLNQMSVYGIKGVADPTNMPGGRHSGVSWIDNQDNLWLFGGSGDVGRALWKFDGVNWTWMSGSSVAGPSVYGIKGRSEPANMPGSRRYCAAWTDEHDNMYLFGGWGLGGIGETYLDGYGLMNDLWKYDGENWAWIGGTDVATPDGVYGTKGVADMANMPGARGGSVSWTDSSGALWLFGGYYRVDVSRIGDSFSDYRYSCYNDLWKFEAWAGDFDMVDFESFSSTWLSESSDPNVFNPAWDLSDPNDGVIDLLDLDAFCEDWLTE